MVDTTQESQDELGKFNQERWDQFVEDSIKKEQDELGKFNQERWDQFVEDSIKKEKEDLEVVKEQSKKNKKESIETLEKHFHDRTLQSLSEFNKTGEKEAGYSSGFQAEHEYSDNEGDKAPFMIKSALNHTLTTEEEKQSKLAQFKKSFYESSRKATKLQNPYLPNFVINNKLDLLWQQVANSICYDDLNIADFIREYVAGDLYKLLLHDRAPIIELVINADLPRKRFVKYDAQNGKDYKPGKYVLEEDEGNRRRYVKGEHDLKDQLRENIELDKNQEQLHMRSKFLSKFTTLMDLKEKGKNYQDAKGFEKILAAQILLGEVDIAHPENLGVIEKEYENAKGKKVKEKLWAKIDHGRSFYLRFSSTKDYLQTFFNFLLRLRSFGVKIDLEKLSKELEDFIDCYGKNKKEFETLIDKKTNSLNHILNPNMQFNLRYIDESGFNVRNFKHTDGEFKGQKEVMADFLSFFMHATSDDSQIASLSDYFKQILETQVRMARSLTGPLKDLAESWKNFDRAKKIYSYIVKPSFYLLVPTLIAAMFTSGTLDTAFAVAEAATGMCMIVGMAASICLFVYATTGCKSKIDNPKVEEYQMGPQLC